VLLTGDREEHLPVVLSWDAFVHGDRGSGIGAGGDHAVLGAGRSSLLKQGPIQDQSPQAIGPVGPQRIQSEHSPPKNRCNCWPRS